MLKLVYKMRFKIIKFLLNKLPAAYSKRMSVLLRYSEKYGDIQLREIIYKKLLRKMGNNIVIKPGTFIKEPEHIIMGSNISIQEFCVISGFGSLEIGNDVSIATGCTIVTSSHVYNVNNVKIRNAKLVEQPVAIGNNVWIGAGCKILGGATIGNNVVVGAGAVVTHSLPDNGVYAGVPAKRIKAIEYTGSD